MTIPADRLTAIVERAVLLEGADRARFVAEACGDDVELRGLVDDMLADIDRPVIIDRPVGEAAADLLGDNSPGMVGTQIGPYRIESRLGAGGMGEVYRATDTQLGRQVAIKTLPAAFAADPERVARFRRESKVLAALNHPHIAAIYGAEVSGGSLALVLELVEGPTLAERLTRGPLPVDEALALARQIAEALEAAHQQGIVHRDLKPGNIKVRDDDRVKVLDFGLAKLVAADSASAAAGAPDTPSATMSPTITTPAMTSAGLILGTAAYMAPEQARGRPVDKRADIWAFGAVLYEMLTGRRAFEGEDVTETLAAVVKSTPDWTLLPADTPRPIRRLLPRLLEKDPRRRVADFSVVSYTLEESATGDAATVGPAARLGWTPMVAAVLVGIAVASAGWGWWAAQTRAPAAEPTVLSQPIGDLDTLRTSVAISPQGTHLAWATPEGLYIRRLENREPQLVPASAGASAPAFSPDGRAVAYLDIDEGIVRRADVDGGAPSNVCTLCGRVSAMHWYDDEWIAYSQQPGDIMRVPASGGKPEPLVRIDPAFYAFGPHVLPGGAGIIFTQAPAAGGFDTAPVLMLQRLPTGERLELVRGGSDGRFHPPTGHLLFARGPTLFAVAFDPVDLEPRRLEAAEPMIRGIQRAQDGVTGAAHYDISRTGTLVYVPGEDPAIAQLFLLRPGQEARPLAIPAGAYDAPRLSPDGERLAFVTRTIRGGEIWILDMTDGAPPQQLTTGEQHEYPVWSDDGLWIVFQAYDGERGRIVRKRADGTGAIEELTNPDEGVIQIPEAWRPGSDEFSFSETRGDETSLWIYSMRDRMAVRFDEQLVSTAAFNSAFSHDGRLIAYTKRAYPEPVRVFVQPLARKDAVFALPGDLPHHPLWSRTRLRLLYFPGGDRLVSVDVAQATGLRFSEATLVPGAFRSNTSATAPRRHDIGPNDEIVARLSPSFRTDQRIVNAEVFLGFGDRLRRQER